MVNWLVQGEERWTTARYLVHPLRTVCKFKSAKKNSSRFDLLWEYQLFGWKKWLALADKFSEWNPQLSVHNYQVELTIVNVTRADEENIHSLKITNRWDLESKYLLVVVVVVVTEVVAKILMRKKVTLSRSATWSFFRMSSSNSLDVEQKFEVFVDRAPIPDEDNSLILIIVIVVIVLLVVVITGKMVVMMTDSNDEKSMGTYLQMQNGRRQIFIS